MKFAVLGADTDLGGKIARDAFHRHHSLTVTVSDSTLLTSSKYTVVDSIKESDFDVVIDALHEGKVIVKKDGQCSELILPKELDTEVHRVGAYSVAKVNSTGESYAGSDDFAMAVVDEAVDFHAATKHIVTEHAPAFPEENSGRRRYIAFPDTGIAGKAFRLYMDNYEEYFVHFITDDTLNIAQKGNVLTSYACKCLHCDDEVWLVMFMYGEKCITLILDEAQSLVTAVSAETLRNKPQVVHHDILFGAIIPFNGETPFRRHGFTDEMAGTKITWHYSPYVNITHCYVNESYMRNSLRNMKPLPADAAPEAVFDAEDRIRRWSDIFFEEPAQFIRINEHLYVVVLAESNRNRFDPVQGGGDMLLAINTRRMRDYGRGYHIGLGTPSFGLISVNGDWDDLPDPIETAQGPYRI